VKDPRVSEDHNDEFLSMLERYFGQDDQKKMEDARPECSYQVGVTPELIETPKCSFDPGCLDFIAKVYFFVLLYLLYNLQ
jgi:hypothetical protein